MSTDAQIITILAVALVLVSIAAIWATERLYAKNVALANREAGLIKSYDTVREQRDAAWEEMRARDNEAAIATVSSYALSSDRDPFERDVLIDQLLSRDADDLERARDAWSRLKERTQIELSLHPDGTGPLFSASKSAMSERALMTIIRQSQEAEEDWDIASKWLVEHPGQYDKLG